VIFKQNKVDTEEIFSLAQVNVWAWLKHKIPSVKYSYNDWYFYDMMLSMFKLSGEHERDSHV